MTCFRTPGWH